MFVKYLYQITIDTLDITVYTLDILATDIEQKPVEVIMATTEAVKERPGRNEMQNGIRALLHEPICSRCGGLMVREFCADLLNSTGELDCSVARCIQCGDVVDPVIRRNRHLQQGAGAVRGMRSSSSPIGDQVSVESLL